jgi:membrane associated rhomboid family serine protease
MWVANKWADRNVGPMNRISPAVTGLLIANIAVFAAGLLVPAWHDQIIATGAFWFPGNDNFRLWQAVSYMFLHANFGHIFFNMFALFSFGPVLEREWGATRFLIFYFVCGVGAALIHGGVTWHEFGGLHERLIAAGFAPSDLDAMLATGSDQIPADPALKAAFIKLYGIFNGPMLGASGAIYGVLVAFGLRHPNAKLALMFLPVPVAAKYFIPILLTLDLFSGVTGFSLFGAGVAHYAHLGGAAIGFLLMLLWRNRHQPPPTGPTTGSQTLR